MAKLDIKLPDISSADDIPKDIVPKKERSKEKTVDQKINEMAAGLPSAHKAKVDAIKRAERTQFSFSAFPVPVQKMFKDEAKKRNMILKEYLWHCLKAGGLDLPDYSEIDGRRR